MSRHFSFLEIGQFLFVISSRLSGCRWRLFFRSHIYISTISKCPTLHGIKRHGTRKLTANSALNDFLSSLHNLVLPCPLNYDLTYVYFFKIVSNRICICMYVCIHIYIFIYAFLIFSSFLMFPDLSKAKSNNYKRLWPGAAGTLRSRFRIPRTYLWAVQ